MRRYAGQCAGTGVVMPVIQRYSGLYHMLTPDQ